MSQMRDSTENQAGSGESAASESSSESPEVQGLLGLPLNQAQTTEQPLSRDRVAIFIDGSSLLHAASHLNIEIDYVRLLARLTQGRELLRAFFYTGVDPSNDKQQGFLHWMNRHGYHVVAKELVLMTDGSRRVTLDVEMAVDMLTISAYCETLMLVSGNGNLTYVINNLAYRGAVVEVLSLRSMASENLINAADHYIDLSSLRDEIRKQNT